MELGSAAVATGSLSECGEGSGGAGTNRGEGQLVLLVMVLLVVVAPPDTRDSSCCMPSSICVTAKQNE